MKVPDANIRYRISIRQIQYGNQKIREWRIKNMANLYTIELNGVSEDVYNKAADFIQAHALRLNYRPEVSTIDCEFPEDLDPDKAPELKEAVIRKVHQQL